MIKPSQQRDKLNRRQTFAALGATLVMPYVQPSWALAPRIRISNRVDNIGETTLEDFEARTGIGVNYLVSEDLAPTAVSEDLSTLPAIQVDVAILPHRLAARAARQGLLSTLDPDLMPGRVALDPRVDLIAFGGSRDAARFGLPYLWGPDAQDKTSYWVDVAVIPSASSFGDHAHRFLSYLLDPGVISACTNFTGRANANLEAAKFVHAELRSNPRIYPLI